MADSIRDALAEVKKVLRDVFAKLAVWLYKEIICQHFCLFKEAGSNFHYTHVHLLGAGKTPDSKNPDGYTGLGHDDETPGLGNPKDAKHNSVSKGKDCHFQPSPSDDMALAASDLKAIYFLTAYFHAASAEGCPEGFFRVKCDCGELCVTFDHQAWEDWHKKLH